MTTRCDVCNQLVRVDGETTRHYVGIEAEVNTLLKEENQNLRNELNEQTRLLGISGSKELKLITENKRLREALEKIEGSEFLDSVSAQIIATKALQGGSSNDRGEK